MSGYKTPKLKSSRICDMHGEEREYFCVSRECMTDLCRLCMRFHDELHREHSTNAAIENYENTIAISLEKLNKMIWGYNEEIKRLELSKGAKENQWETFVNEVRQKILKAKRAIETFVDAFFQEMETEAMNQYLYPSKKLSIDKLETPIERLMLKVEKLEHFKRYLTKDKKEKEMIKYVFYKDERYILETLKSKVDEIIEKESIFVPNSEKVEIVWRKENLSNFYSILADFVTLDVDLKYLTTDNDSYNLTNFGDLTHDLNNDISVYNNNYKDQTNYLNSSLGKEEQRKIPNPYPKESLRSLIQNSTPSKNEPLIKNSSTKKQLPPTNPEPIRTNSRPNIFENNDEGDLELLKSKPKKIGLDFPAPNKQINSFGQNESKSKFEIVRKNKPDMGSEEISIQVENFFSEDSLFNGLHFFEPKTKNLYFIDFSDEKFKRFNSSNKLSFEKIELDIDFTLNRHTRSVITPCGLIVLLGGLLEKSHKSEKVQLEFLNTAYLVDFSQGTLLQMAKMKYGRAAHSVVMVGNNIIVAGGITDNCVVTDTCEEYDFDKEFWKEIGRMNEATMNSTLALVNNKYVVKFGGKIDETHLSKNIEILDLDKSKWKFIKTEIDLPVIPSLASALEIKKGHILFFGGVYESVAEKSNLIYDVGISEDGALLKFEKKDFTLPNEGGFWDQQGILHNGSVFALQNISNPQNQHSYFMNNRKIIYIDKFGCKTLN